MAVVEAAIRRRQFITASTFLIRARRKSSSARVTRMGARIRARPCESCSSLCRESLNTSHGPPVERHQTLSHVGQSLVQPRVMVGARDCWVVTAFHEPCVARRVFDCGGWRGTGLTLLWRDAPAASTEPHLKAVYAPSPSPTAVQDAVAPAYALARSWQCAIRESSKLSIPDSGTGVSPVRFDSNGRDARATKVAAPGSWPQCAILKIVEALHEPLGIFNSTFNIELSTFNGWPIETL